MSDLREVHQRSLRGYEYAMQECNMNFQQARLRNDMEAMVEASQQIANLRVGMNELNNMAREAYAAAPRDMNRFGLSKDEVEVANSHPDSSMTPDQKQELYLRNKQKYQHMRMTGEYRDDQGMVRR
ncbi:hypothetical protein NLM31_21040 [Bradyrhizobium sp. CCGUVB4N]|uniref:hypothetical protein n=1 Tax=Bradyrhizobium sp. CCGUVB4N TaxID=2949631 RepID=UPI0020B38468|nr:hypothetical protein [Bradyrhizobium sp. CCGUVB4N]MCP3382856.1 hypothetical protein [Bradyrhizobium sp. CCGUVB4N]